MKHLLIAIMIVSIVSPLIGCQAQSSRPHRGADAAQSGAAQPELARAKHELALTAIDAGDIDAAEALLREALDADIMFGPAHNNLGKIYFQQRKLYEAAWRFEYAIKLMPDQPEPRNNLGLVLEHARRLDDAIVHYTDAHDLAPDNVEILGNLVRSRLRRGDRDSDVRRQLEDLVLKDTRPDWLAWAHEHLSRLVTRD